jgi:hypothetical protein
LCGCETYSLTIYVEGVSEQGVKENIELHNLYASPNIIMVIKSMRIGWVENVAHMRNMRNACIVMVGKIEGKIPFSRPKRRRKIILEWILRK